MRIIAVATGMDSPSAALADAQRQASAQQTFEKAVENVKEENKSFAAILQNSISKNANPNPVIIAVLVVLVIIILWSVHRYFAPSIWGVWYDASGSKYVIGKGEHTKVQITGGTKTYAGALSKNVLDLEGGLGLWNGSNRILLPDNTMLTKFVPK